MPVATAAVYFAGHCLGTGCVLVAAKKIEANSTYMEHLVIDLVELQLMLLDRMLDSIPATALPLGRDW
jgi:hypothetical protein